MYLYTLGFIIRGTEVLMLNRNFEPWKGYWNGIGGKRKTNESAIECIIRETKEETGISVTNNQIEDKGIVTWNTFNAADNGLHLFIIKVNKDFEYHTPKQTREGILEWKQITWVNDNKNTGVSHNIPYFLPIALSDNKRYKHICLFKNNVLLNVEKMRIN